MGHSRVLGLVPFVRPSHLHLLPRCGATRSGHSGGGRGCGGRGGVLTLEELHLSRTGDTERLREVQEQGGAGREETKTQSISLS